MSVFNECLIHFCDCTWLNVLYILYHILIKHKIFFEYFSCFWKLFLFWKFSEIQKFSTLLFGDSLTSHANRDAPIASLHKRFRDSLVSETSSHEKYLQKLSKIMGFYHFRDYFESRRPVTRVLREVCNSLASGCPNCEKDLDKIFKILYKGFWRLILATCLRVIWVAKNMCFAQIRLNLR